MKGNDPKYSRIGRKKRHNRSNQLLNVLIGLVVVLILIVGATLVFGGKDDNDKEKAEQEDVTKTTETEESDNESDPGLTVEDDDEASSVGKNDNGDVSDGTGDDSQGTSGSDGRADQTEEEEKEDGGTVIVSPSDEEIVAETIIDPAWSPIGTDQTGEHVSLYDGESVDWNEKKKAIAYAAGVSVDDLFYKRIKNGGSPQKAIGIVTTKDEAKKYRVYLEWIDGAGWKPVKMDVLNTLDFDY